MTYTEVERFVDRYSARLSSERQDMLQELSRLTGVESGVLAEHLQGLEDREPLIERILLFEPGNLERNENEIVALVQRIMDAEGSEAQQDEWLRVITANIPVPVSYLTGLIFYSADDRSLTAKEVVERATAYVPRITTL